MIATDSGLVEAVVVVDVVVAEPQALHELLHVLIT